MKKILFVMSFILLLNYGLVNAITQQEINEAKKLIDLKVDCKSLSDSQLEIIGEYSMELMHPGDSHESMHKMMGIKEGSEAEKQFHINLAKTIYCGESGGMMDMMMGNNMMDSRIMGNFGYGFWYLRFLNILYVILLIGLIILIYLWIIKLWKAIKDKGVKK